MGSRTSWYRGNKNADECVPIVLSLGKTMACDDFLTPLESMQ